MVALLSGVDAVITDSNGGGSTTDETKKHATFQNGDTSLAGRSASPVFCWPSVANNRPRQSVVPICRSTLSRGGATAANQASHFDTDGVSSTNVEPHGNTDGESSDDSGSFRDSGAGAADDRDAC